jgi:FMN phosphatase YigB (HAD superfamily)
MTNGSSGVNSKSVLIKLFDVWKFIEDAKESGKLNPDLLAKAEAAFKEAHSELKDSMTESIMLGDSEQRCLGGVPYW